MRRAKEHPLIRRLVQEDGLLLAFGVSVAVLVTGILVVLFASEPAWALANVAVFGFPAFWLVVGAREGVRFLVAKAFGFELLGIHWGCGKTMGKRRRGFVHYRIAPIPLGADARYVSSQPVHHRLARWSLLVVPLGVQFIVLMMGRSSGALSIDSIAHGFSPLATIYLANAALLAAHCLVPFEISSGLMSDLRRMSVLAFSDIEEDRQARATACTLRIEQLLEEGDIARVESELHDAVHQLGREPMLIHLEDRLERIRHAPDPKTAAYADAVCDPFEHAWAIWDRDTRPLSGLERAIRTGFRYAPIALATAIVLAAVYDVSVRSAHERWTQEAPSITAGRDADACRAHLAAYAARRSPLLRSTPMSPPARIREYSARAALSACAGDLKRALRNQSRAVTIADAYRNGTVASLAPDSSDRVEAERLHCSELRQLGAWHAANGAYRNALRTTRNAQELLNAARSRAAATAPSVGRDQALASFGREGEDIERTRQQILALMDERG